MRGMKFSWSKCAEILLVSRTTLWRYFSELGILREPSDISDMELDCVVRNIIAASPNYGSVMAWGQLKAYGIVVSRKRVRDSLYRVSPNAVRMRCMTTVSRRVYSVPSSNALWHIDGLHCFIRWRIVIHGGIDGYSRRITYLHASTNNRADTVLKLFLEATGKCGWPSRVRSDLGGENVDVARVQIEARGTGRHSHIAGSSVHNQRIERLWRDTFRCICHPLYSLFYEMEDSGLLSPTNETDLLCLHYVFLPRLNTQLEHFCESWNNHTLRTEGLTPLQLWTRGMCIAAPSVVNQPTDDFGVEYGLSPNPFDQGSIEVPELTVELSEDQAQHLQSHYPPLTPSDYNGLDVYISVREEVGQMTLS